ncbi:NAD(P)-dependent dehydrogenase (short-subunit alcohol dehydrogenase family) [Stella humosa]|uniref:NAD(P)-dependent dehydrogenase (Short-subunit alcohol dehydrogenase family) n=1 Tax=Stella humosa TaxID=94 RepID=A0A3N1M7B4_9PROT|nr:glucose 1-dehydrogenase [Stella humosa]ROQ01712.1 NAD(P)-dependent dehydrogenase (short-subunit alcohol dehydrogenase family) [Stella humosa]BBK32094.1 3-oxoacyl-ACP reductase [Stella humosa]
MEISLTDKIALVTGASSGLGRHFARTLAASGARVAVAARRTDRLQDLAREIAAAGGQALPVALDVTDPASIDAAIARVAAELGPIDILVNNSGVATAKPALETTAEDWDGVMDTNLRGAFLVAQAVARHLVAAKRPGAIVNIASVTAMRTMGQLSAYAASKAGLDHLTRVLALEWARHGIRVNAIAPGYIETEINSAFFASPAGEAVIKRIPQRRLGQPSDLDGALMLLASDAGRYMTGATIIVDGGHVVSPL